jgi:sugar phosphate isomerase/epimerase
MALGEGNCDIPAVIKAAKDIGLEWVVVENDDPVPTGFEDITRSIKYLKSII